MLNKQVNLNIVILIALIGFVGGCALMWVQGASLIGILGGGSLAGIWFGIMGLMVQLREEPKKPVKNIEEKHN